MWDYGQRPPLWADDIESLGLPESLIMDLNAGADDVEARAEAAQRWRRPPADDEMRVRSLDDAGRALAVRVKALLGDEWAVTYFSELSQTDEVIAGPPSPPVRHRHRRRRR